MALTESVGCMCSQRGLVGKNVLRADQLLEFGDEV
jgi:hypothetical protein